MPAALNNPVNQLVLAILLGTAGLYLLLPRPKRRSVALGSFLAIAAVAVFGHFINTAFGSPLNHVVGDILFWLFSAVALLFGTILVTQRNPARGAIAFAFVILSTCGLFLLLAAPFLMAASVIIYAGAIIVTFLFVLMLSHQAGPSDENDRTREPLLGSLAGFAFVGLICFTLLQSSGEAQAVLPQPPLTAEDKEILGKVRADFDKALANDGIDEVRQAAFSGRDQLANVVGPGSDSGRKSVTGRLKLMAYDPRSAVMLKQTDNLRTLNTNMEDAILDAQGDVAAMKLAIRPVRDQVVIYSGNGQLPARNVANIGYILYSEHILTVELAGTLLLVATIGAVAIAQRRKGSAA